MAATETLKTYYIHLLEIRGGEKVNWYTAALAANKAEATEKARAEFNYRVDVISVRL